MGSVMDFGGYQWCGISTFFFFWFLSHEACHVSTVCSSGWRFKEKGVKERKAISGWFYFSFRTGLCGGVFFHMLYRLFRPGFSPSVLVALWSGLAWLGLGLLFLFSRMFWLVFATFCFVLVLLFLFVALSVSTTY